jgi:hypothetical protein
MPVPGVSMVVTMGMIMLMLVVILMRMPMLRGVGTHCAA